MAGKEFSENQKTAIKEDWLVNELNILVGALSKKYDLPREKIIEMLSETSVNDDPEAVSIPVELFSDRSLGALQIVVKFLIEHRNFNQRKIAELLKRDSRTIWATYAQAKRKHPQKLIVKDSKYSIPISYFSNRWLGPLEVIVVYLRDKHKLTYAQISVILARDQRTIWATYAAAIRKLRGNDKNS